MVHFRGQSRLRTLVMWIRIVRKPAITNLDGIGLEHFEVGAKYEVGNAVGALLLAEGWAEPLPLSPPAAVLPFIETPLPARKPRAGSTGPPNLVRDTNPPYFDRLNHVPLAADLDKRRRSPLRLVERPAKSKD